MIDTDSGSAAPDNQAILDRIDRLERTLLGGRDGQRNPDTSTQFGNATPATSNTCPVPDDLGDPTTGHDPSFFTVESVLRWPVFNEQYRACLNLRELMTNPSLGSSEYLSPQSSGKGQARMSVELESCSRLLDNFFTRIHIKNPVLDEKEVRQWAREISFNGVGWDGHSCLVVSSPSQSRTKLICESYLFARWGPFPKTFHLNIQWGSRSKTPKTIN